MFNLEIHAKNGINAKQTRQKCQKMSTSHINVCYSFYNISNCNSQSVSHLLRYFSNYFG